MANRDQNGYGRPGRRGVSTDPVGSGPTAAVPASASITLTQGGAAEIIQDEATGVRLKVTGRGISFNTSVEKINGGTTRAVKLKPKKAGKIKATFKVTPSNAGSKTVKKTITVKK